MESKKNEAIQVFMNHYNCCQAVVLGHKDLIRQYHPELDNSSLERMAVAFGGGVAGSGGICGALSGLCMVLGLISTEDFMDPAFKQKQRDDIKELMDAFEDRFGSINCRDIRDNINLEPFFENDPDNKELYAQKPCNACVSYASDLISGFLSK